MKLDRIVATLHARAPLARGAEQPLPRPGESLLLTYNDTEGADLLATLGNGLALRLAGLGRQHDLQPGDMLRVRVLATEPVLELEVEGRSARSVAAEADAGDAGTAAMSRHTAMRLDQAVLRQMAWLAPNAAALALSWRDLAQERWSGRVPSHEVAGEPAAALPTTMLGPAPFREPISTLPPPLLSRWLFPVYAWGGIQMLLGLAQGEDEGQPKRRPGRRQSPVLRLELAPIALGHIVIHVQWRPGGVLLLIAVEQAESAELVRDALPLVAAALARAGLQLASFRLTQGSAAIAALRNTPDPQLQTYIAAHALPLTLFRALAETAVVLLQVVPGQHGISRASR